MKNYVKIYWDKCFKILDETLTLENLKKKKNR